jgi:hypothetical protein
MTKTALRALTVLGALAVALTSTPAVAHADGCLPGQDTSTPECPNPWPDTTNVTVCMADPQACAPAPGPDCPGAEDWDGTRCVAVQLPTETTGRRYEPTASSAASTPTTTAAADSGSAPAASDGERVSTDPATPTTAGLPGWVILDKVMEILRALIRALTGTPAVD